MVAKIAYGWQDYKREIPFGGKPLWRDIIF